MSKLAEHIIRLREGYEPTAELLPELACAREDRAAGRHTSPSRLYYLSEAIGDRYIHAMIEVGNILERGGGQPFAICPICDFVLDEAAA